MDNPGPPHDGPPVGDSSLSSEEVTCQQFVELVTDYFEGALPPRTLSRVEEHLVLCDWCVNYVEQMQTTIAALHDLKGEPPEEVPDTLLAALRANRAVGG